MNLKKCKHCEKAAENDQYDMCKECWWDQDPRNVKNGGTVDLEKYKKENETVTTSLNNRFILEPYKGDRALKANASSGFAIVQQKVSLVGLTLLADVDLARDVFVQTFSKGSKAYIKEEELFTQQWALKVFESDAIQGKFIIVDAAHVQFVVAE